MASSPTFSSWTFHGSMLAPKTTKHCSKFIYDCLNSCFNQTISSISPYASHDMRSPNGKGVDWAWGRLSLKSRSQCRALKVGIESSYSVGNKFQLEDVIEAYQFDRDALGVIFEVALEMEKIEKNSTGSQMLKDYLTATLFYESSTRTRLSFESAMKRLDEVLTTENALDFSSAAKGETLEDTIRTVEGYSDIIVIRHLVLPEEQQQRPAFPLLMPEMALDSI